MNDRPPMIDAAPLAAELRAWVAAGGKLDTLPAGPARRARAILNGEQTTIRLDALDRLALALDRPWLVSECAPPEPSTKRSGVWAKPHPLRRLTPEQVTAAHTLHVGGMSLRELGRQLYERLGYASAKSCTMALSQAFRRAGLTRRDRIEATVAASTVHGRGARTDKAAYKRWHRATYGPWPSDDHSRYRGDAA
jgi:hypothetical protein